MNSMHHSFDIELAAKYGVHEALMIHHFQHWIMINKRLKRNFHEGKTWTYQTLEEIAAHFPYLTIDQVRAVIEKLCTGKGRRSEKEEYEFEPILVKGNFNKTSFDRTTWYAFSNSSYEREISQIEKGELPNPNGSPPKPIPDSLPDTKAIYIKEGQAAKPLPSRPKNSKKTIEDKKEVAERVFVSESQHKNLLDRAKNDENLVKRWYNRLSEWKVGKSITDCKSDYLRVVKWVIQAVSEDLQTHTFQKKEKSCSPQVRKGLPPTQEILDRMNEPSIFAPLLREK